MVNIRAPPADYGVMTVHPPTTPDTHAVTMDEDFDVGAEDADGLDQEVDVDVVDTLELVDTGPGGIQLYPGIPQIGPAD